MNTVWNTVIDGLNKIVVKPIDIKDLPTQKYHMGQLRTGPADSRTLRLGKRFVLPVERAAVDTTISKAESVRIMIRMARVTNVSVDTVIAKVQHELSMAGPLASTYVKNNWNCD